MLTLEWTFWTNIIVLEVVFNIKITSLCSIPRSWDKRVYIDYINITIGYKYPRFNIVYVVYELHMTIPLPFVLHCSGLPRHHRHKACWGRTIYAQGYVRSIHWVSIWGTSQIKVPFQNLYTIGSQIYLIRFIKGYAILQIWYPFGKIY